MDNFELLLYTFKNHIYEHEAKNVIITQEMLITVLYINKYLEISDNKPIEFLIGKNNQNLYTHRNTQVYKLLLKLGEKKR